MYLKCNTNALHMHFSCKYCSGISRHYFCFCQFFLLVTISMYLPYLVFYTYRMYYICSSNLCLRSRVTGTYIALSSHISYIIFFSHYLCTCAEHMAPCSLILNIISVTRSSLYLDTFWLGQSLAVPPAHQPCPTYIHPETNMSSF